eukprot:COSAG01_NODE_12201_length_1781_cov_9.123662_1_plen_357_part_10
MDLSCAGPRDGHPVILHRQGVHRLGGCSKTRPPTRVYARPIARRWWTGASRVQSWSAMSRYYPGDDDDESSEEELFMSSGGRRAGPASSSTAAAPAADAPSAATQPPPRRRSTSSSVAVDGATVRLRKPAGLLAAERHNPSSPWVVYKDARGVHYYHNTSTNATSWDIPIEGVKGFGDAADADDADMARANSDTQAAEVASLVKQTMRGSKSPLLSATTAPTTASVASSTERSTSSSSSAAAAAAYARDEGTRRQSTRSSARAASTYVAGRAGANQRGGGGVNSVTSTVQQRQMRWRPPTNPAPPTTTSPYDRNIPGRGPYICKPCQSPLQFHLQLQPLPLQLLPMQLLPIYLPLPA